MVLSISPSSNQISEHVLKHELSLGYHIDSSSYATISHQTFDTDNILEKVFKHFNSICASVNTIFKHSDRVCTFIVDDFISPTSHPTIPTASTGLAPSSSRTADSRFSAPADPQARRAPLGSTVVVLILLGFMLAMATMMWLAESKGRKKSQRSECQERKIMSKPRKNVEPVGLGIILHPADEGRKEIEVSERLKGWLSIVVERGKSANMTGRWTEFAVSRTRTDLGMNAEEGLLLPVRESERIGIKKDQIGIELDADPRVLRDAKK